MRDKQREETRRRLYHAALEIFCRDGVANCRIEDIVDEAVDLDHFVVNCRVLDNQIVRSRIGGSLARIATDRRW